MQKVQSMPNPNGQHEQKDQRGHRKGKAYLLVQEPPGAIGRTGSFPAQDTGEHEHEQNKVADKCGDGTDSDVRDMIDRTTAISPVPAGCGYD